MKTEYKFADRTAQGWKIIFIGMDKWGNLHVIADSGPDTPQRYAVGKYYDISDGVWSNGSYYTDNEFTHAYRKWREYVKYIDFNPEDEKDIKFYESRQYNWNNVATGYLEDHDYREEGFDPKAHPGLF